MECQRYNEKLSAYSDGALSRPDSERVRAHLGTCDRCRAELSELKTLKALLRALPVPSPRPSFWADAHRTVRLTAQSRTLPAPRHSAAHRMHLGWGIAVAAVFVLAVLAAPRKIDRPMDTSGPAIKVAALVSLHANLRADRPFEDAGWQRYAASDAVAADLADDNQLDVD